MGNCAFYAFLIERGDVACRTSLPIRLPKYADHKASGQAAVKFGGKVRYLGPQGSPESKARYQLAVAEWARQTQLSRTSS